jgi:hypothetical protein
MSSYCRDIPTKPPSSRSGKGAPLLPVSILRRSLCDGKTGRLGGAGEGVGERGSAAVPFFPDEAACPTAIVSCSTAAVSCDREGSWRTPTATAAVSLPPFILYNAETSMLRTSMAKAALATVSHGRFRTILHTSQTLRPNNDLCTSGGTGVDKTIGCGTAIGGGPSIGTGCNVGGATEIGGGADGDAVGAAFGGICGSRCGKNAMSAAGDVGLGDGVAHSGMSITALH